MLLRQDGDEVEVGVRAPETIAAKAADQALAALSLDVDGTDRPAVGSGTA